MSNYRADAFNPGKGCVEPATWLDNHFGSHAYGVQFDGEEKVYRPFEVDFSGLAQAYAASLSREAALVEALKMTQFGFNGRCPVCAGFNVGPYGETDGAHTATCPVAAALAQSQERT